MLSARSLFHQIHTDDEAFRLFCSLAAAGEAQGGWENARIAVLVHDPELAPKIVRHGADEDKHGRIFKAVARPEIRVYRDVSLAVMARMGELLNWPGWQRAVLAFGIRLKYGYEWLHGWRRLVRVRMPERPGRGRQLPAPPAPA